MSIRWGVPTLAREARGGGLREGEGRVAGGRAGQRRCCGCGSDCGSADCSGLWVGLFWESPTMALVLLLVSVQEHKQKKGGPSKKESHPYFFTDTYIGCFSKLGHGFQGSQKEANLHLLDGLPYGQWLMCARKHGLVGTSRARMDWPKRSVGRLLTGKSLPAPIFHKALISQHIPCGLGSVPPWLSGNGSLDFSF